jgi:hypothetical protein
MRFVVFLLFNKQYISLPVYKVQNYTPELLDKKVLLKKFKRGV